MRTMMTLLFLLPTAASAQEMGALMEICDGGCALQDHLFAAAAQCGVTSFDGSTAVGPALVDGKDAVLRLNTSFAPATIRESGSLYSAAWPGAAVTHALAVDLDGDGWDEWFLGNTQYGGLIASGPIYGPWGYSSGSTGGGIDDGFWLDQISSQTTGGGTDTGIVARFSSTTTGGGVDNGLVAELCDLAWGVLPTTCHPICE